MQRPMNYNYWWFFQCSNLANINSHFYRVRMYVTNKQQPQRNEKIIAWCRDKENKRSLAKVTKTDKDTIRYHQRYQFDIILIAQSKVIPLPLTWHLYMSLSLSLKDLLIYYSSKSPANMLKGEYLWILY